MPEHTGSYFDISGLHAPGKAEKEYGSLYERACEILGANGLRAVLRQVSSDYFSYDKQVETHMRFSEDLSNAVNRSFLLQPECEKLLDTIESNPDHGYSHFRRVEKFAKEILARDKHLRSREDVLYFVPAMYLTIRFHDLVEVYTKKKEDHDAAAALLALGVMRQSKDIVRAFVFGRTGERSFPDQDYEKLTWATVFMCLHHSKPERMPSPQELAEKGLLHPRELLGRAEAVAKNAGKRLEEFFPPYKFIAPTIESVAQDALDTKSLTGMSQVDLEALQVVTRLVAAADKLDGYEPVGLSAARTVLTRPERKFLDDDQGLYGTTEEELDARIRDGGRHESRCDVNRLLFELTRTGSFSGISPWINVRYSRALLRKGEFVFGAVQQFLNGNFEPYLTAYDELENDMVETLLQKAAIPIADIHDIMIMKNPQDRHTSVGRILAKHRIDPGVLDALLYTLRQERQSVADALQAKYEGLGTVRDDQKLKNHVVALFRMAIERQRREVLRYPGPHDLPVPYKGYYFIDLERWRLPP